MAAYKLNSPSELDWAINDATIVVVWVYESDKINEGFKEQFEKIAKDNPGATYWKIGTDDLGDAMKKTYGMERCWVFVYKNGKKVGDRPETHSGDDAVDLLVKKALASR